MLLESSEITRYGAELPFTNFVIAQVRARRAFDRRFLGFLFRGSAKQLAHARGSVGREWSRDREGLINGRRHVNGTYAELSKRRRKIRLPAQRPALWNRNYSCATIRAIRSAWYNGANKRHHTVC